MLDVSRAFTAILIGAYKVTALRATWTMEAQLKAFQTGTILTTGLDGLLSLAGEMLRQGNLESVVLLLVMLMLICNKKKRQVDQKEIKLYSLERKRALKSLAL